MQNIIWTHYNNQQREDLKKTTPRILVLIRSTDLETDTLLWPTNPGYLGMANSRWQSQCSQAGLMQNSKCYCFSYNYLCL